MLVFRLLYLLFPGLLLLGWSMGKDSLSCMPALLLMLPVAGLIALNMLEVSLMRRRAMVGMYLHSASRLARLLCRKLFLLLWQVLKAAFFTFILFVEVLDWSAWFWLVLLTDALALFVMNHRLQQMLQGQVKAGQEGIIARRILVTLNTLVLVLLLATGQLFERQIDYRDLSWQETAMHAAQQQLQCELLAPLVRVQAIQQALAGRFVRQGLESVSSSWSRIFGWLLFFFWSGLSFWAWSRMLLGTLICKPDIERMVRQGCE